MIRKVLALLIAIMCLLGGKGNMESKLELTETEINLLVSTGFNERRIRAGELTHVELEDLDVIRYTVRRMEELYPGLFIEYISMNVGAQGGAGYSFTAYEKSHGPDDPFVIYTEVGGTPEEPKYTCSDTLAGQIMYPEFKKFIRDLLKQNGLDFLNFDAALPYRVDEEFDRSCPVAQLIADGKCPPCNIRVEIDACGIDQPAFDNYVGCLEKVFRERGLTGSVLILAYDTDSGNSPSGSWERVVFRAQILL